jgi:hypothetical protein
MILDAGAKIYVWHGSYTNSYEKTRAVEVAKRIKEEERQGKAEVIILKIEGSIPFWTLLGGRTRVKTITKKAAEDDDVKEDLKIITEKFMKVSVTEDNQLRILL